jgi:hypothetical protein
MIKKIDGSHKSHNSPKSADVSPRVKYLAGAVAHIAKEHHVGEVGHSTRSLHGRVTKDAPISPKEAKINVVHNKDHKH